MGDSQTKELQAFTELAKEGCYYMEEEHGYEDLGLPSGIKEWHEAAPIW